jgi:hypothetical protein
MTAVKTPVNAGFSKTLAIALASAIVLLPTIFGCSDQATVSMPPDRGSAEHKYVTERFRREGFNSSDAQQAADAVMKFHKAQQNR